MGEGLGGASTCLLVATAGAIVSYIPIGALAAKIGRKRTIQCGIVLLAACFILGYVLTTLTVPSAHYVRGVCAGGLAWAAINVNVPAYGGGDVPRQRHRQVYRVLLHLLDGRPGGNPIVAGS